MEACLHLAEAVCPRFPAWLPLAAEDCPRFPAPCPAAACRLYPVWRLRADSRRYLAHLRWVEACLHLVEACRRFLVPRPRPADCPHFLEPRRWVEACLHLVVDYRLSPAPRWAEVCLRYLARPLAEACHLYLARQPVADFRHLVEVCLRLVEACLHLVEACLH